MLIRIERRRHCRKPRKRFSLFWKRQPGSEPGARRRQQMIDSFVDFGAVAQHLQLRRRRFKRQFARLAGLATLTCRDSISRINADGSRGACELVARRAAGSSFDCRNARSLSASKLSERVETKKNGQPRATTGENAGTHNDARTGRRQSRVAIDKEHASARINCQESGLQCVHSISNEARKKNEQRVRSCTESLGEMLSSLQCIRI